MSTQPVTALPLAPKRKPPRAPAHLSARSRKLWRRLVEDYGLDEEPHALEVLRLALEAVDRAEEARSLLAREGLTVTDRFGQVKAHPMCAVERDSAIRAARMFRELSLDGDVPSDARVPRVGGGRS